MEADGPKRGSKTGRDGRRNGHDGCGTRRRTCDGWRLGYRGIRSSRARKYTSISDASNSDGGGGEPGDEGGRGKTDVEELEGMLERFLFCGDDRNVRRVYVQGRLVGGKEHTAR